MLSKCVLTFNPFSNNDANGNHNLHDLFLHYLELQLIPNVHLKSTYFIYQNIYISFLQEMMLV